MIGQRLNTASTIGSTPLHQAGAGTAGNLDNLGHAVAEAIEAYGLQARPMRTITGAVVGCEQAASSRVGKFKRSVSHVHYCTSFT
jgi:hypothetical protein